MRGPASDAALAHLRPEDEEAITAGVRGTELEAVWTEHREHDRRLALVLACHLELPDFLARSGLSAAVPPPEIHSMSRGPLSSGGDFAIADLVLEEAQLAGVAPRPGGAGLDFGGSSGRVARVLAAAQPEVRWSCCDPNADAPAWGAANLPMVTFFRSPQRPPLPLDDASLDLVVAISVWSHFAPEPAAAFLSDLRRVVRPGGGLVLTTHGWPAVAEHLRNTSLTEGAGRLCVEAMLREGRWYVSVFGPDGDWGVVDDGWGQAYLTLEALVALAPGWSVARCVPGGLQGVQDVITLRRDADYLPRK